MHRLALAHAKSWTALTVGMLVVFAVAGLAVDAAAQTTDIVLYSTDATARQGNWSLTPASGVAGGARMASIDQGWSSANAPLASPPSYFEIPFDAPAGTVYRVWVRLRATADSKWNDAIWMQFSDSLLTSGAAAYRIGTTSGLLVNLERCSGCAASGWGWHNAAWWLTQETQVKFAAAGRHTVRVQLREDGVEVDQIVLSPITFASKAPGTIINDTTIVAKPAPPPPSGSTPYSGAPAPIPGTINAAEFDHGGQGVAYHDTTSGNAGGAFRSTDVDLQSSHGSGYNVGWTVPGEWLNYTVNVASGGNYNLQMRVAAIAGATLELTFASPSNVNRTVAIPSTGAWQTYSTVTVPMTLAAGTQRMTLKITGGETNIRSITAALVVAAPPPPSVSTPYNGTPAALPGTIKASDFDHGGQGVAYYDTTGGNAGGAYRQTDVDLQAASVGGYNVGWTAAGEWLNYTVNVASAGNYDVYMRVASIAGATAEVTFASPSSVTRSIAIPGTGGWQTYSGVGVSVPMTLAAGTQRLTVKITGGEVNIVSITASAVVVAPPPPPPPPPTSGGSFRMLTWNIKHGHNLNGSYDPVSQAQFIASQNPHVVLLQEVQTWKENLPARYEALLEQYTGVPWSMQWAPVINSQSTEGNVVLTRLPVVSSTYHQMHATGDWTAMYSNRSVAQATVLVGGVPVNVFSTHLDYYNTTHRTAQLLDMMAWAAKFGPRRIVGGDFNSWWGEYWTITMRADYYDTWQDITGSLVNGHTIGDVRFDYLFRAKEAAYSITPTRIVTPWTSLSDHNPVIADYTVKP
jgi:endonuclease/exonuclease/phosphatase family metal-dependent hydrolase